MTHAKTIRGRALLILLSLLLLQAALPGCFGRWALTRKLYGVNQSIGDKWLRSIVTFVMVAVPIYGFCAFVDWAFFNTVEFWNGTNPIDGQNADPPREPALPETKVTVSEGSEIRLFLSADGDRLRVESQRPGEEKRMLVLSMNARNAELRDGKGQLISTLTQTASGAQIRAADGTILEEKSASETASLEQALRAGGREFLAELTRQTGRRVAAK